MRKRQLATCGPYPTPSRYLPSHPIPSRHLRSLFKPILPTCGTLPALPFLLALESSDDANVLRLDTDVSESSPLMVGND